MRRFTRNPPREQGSAMLFALMGLVFLTVIGLSLAVVTETEMIIGNNEQIAQETFFAAETGVASAVGQLLVENSMSRKYFALESKDGDATRNAGPYKLGYSVDFTNIYPVVAGPAAYTKANEGEEGLKSYFFITTVRARRLAWPIDQSVPKCDQFQDARDLGFGVGGGGGGDGDTTDPDAYDEFENVLAEKYLTFGFYVSPLGQLTELQEGFVEAEKLACGD